MRTHAACIEIHATRGSMQVTRGRKHQPRGQMQATRRCKHRTRGQMQLTRGSMHATPVSIQIPRGRSHRVLGQIQTTMLAMHAARESIQMTRERTANGRLGTTRAGLAARIRREWTLGWWDRAPRIAEPVAATAVVGYSRLRGLAATSARLKEPETNRCRNPR